MLRKYLVYAFVLFVVLAMNGCEWGFDEQKSMQNAQKYQKDGDHNSAIVELKKILKHNSTNKNARLMLGESYVETGQGEAAEKELKMAEKLGVVKSDMIDAWAKTLLIQKKYTDLLQEISLDQAKTDLQKAKLRLMHGYAHAALGHKPEAYKLFKMVSDSALLPAEANIALSRHAMSSQDTAQALKYIDNALAADKTNTTAWLQKGGLYLATQNFLEATNAFEKVIENSDKSRLTVQAFQARVYLTEIALTQQNMPLARQRVDLLNKAQPNHPQSLYLSALVDYSEKKFDTSKTALEKILAQFPNELRSKFLLGAVQYALGNYEQANKHLSYFVENVPTHVQARKLLGAVRVKLGQNQDAMEAMKPIADKSNDAQLLMMIGRAAVLNNDLQDAEKYYKQAKATDPDNQLLRKELASIYLSRGSIDDAIQELGGISGKDKAQAEKILVYAHLRKHDFSSARKLTASILKKTDNKAEALSLAGLVELSAGDRAVARNYFESAHKQDQKYLPALLSLARLDFEDGKFIPAKEKFTSVLGIDNNNINAMMGLSFISGRENNTSEAVQWLLKAKEKNQQALAPRIVLSKFYLSTGKIDEALALLNESMTISKIKVELMPLLITAQLRKGQKTEAMATAREFVKLKPGDSIAHIQQAGVYQATGDITAAERSLVKALEIEPASEPANIALVNLYVAQAKYEAALKVAKRITQRYPKLTMGYFLEGEIYLAQKQYDKSITSLAYVNKQSPSSAITRKMALAYRLNGNTRQAIRTLEDWVRATPNDLSARMDLALYYEYDKQLSKSQHEYHTILETSPDNVAVLNNLALSYLDTDKKKALAYAEKASQLKPDIPAISDTLGWILLDKGDNARAVTLLEKAAAKSQNPTIQYHYAVALGKTGEVARAKEILTDVLAKPADFPEKTLAKQLLKTYSH